MNTKYRIYADGTVYHEDDFNDLDNSVPSYDDYETVEVPDIVVLYIAEMANYSTSIKTIKVGFKYEQD